MRPSSLSSWFALGLPNDFVDCCRRGGRRLLGPGHEKQPLERYVAPARSSLVGLLRIDLVAVLGGVGVAPPQQRMRVQQIW